MIEPLTQAKLRIDALREHLTKIAEGTDLATYTLNPRDVAKLILKLLNPIQADLQQANAGSKIVAGILQTALGYLPEVKVNSTVVTNLADFFTVGKAPTPSPTPTPPAPQAAPSAPPQDTPSDSCPCMSCTIRRMVMRQKTHN